MIEMLLVLAAAVAAAAALAGLGYLLLWLLLHEIGRASCRERV